MSGPGTFIGQATRASGLAGKVDPNIQNREDIVAIVGMTNEAFDSWYASRLLAVRSLMETWELFASIPNLSYNSPMTHSSKTVIREVIDSIRNAESDLEKILQIREDGKHATDFNDT